MDLYLLYILFLIGILYTFYGVIQKILVSSYQVINLSYQIQNHNFLHEKKFNAMLSKNSLAFTMSCAKELKMIMHTKAP